MVRKLAEWQCDYLVRNIREEGGFFSLFEPFQNRLYRGHDVARGMHATWILLRAAHVLNREGAIESASRVLDEYIDKLRESSEGIWLEDEDSCPSVAELSFLLLALVELDAGDHRRALGPRIAAALASRIDAHGRISTHRDAGAGTDEFQDYFPGQVLLALAAAVLAGFVAKETIPIRRALLYYRHRFRYKRNFGQVSWLMQAGRLWWEVDRDSDWAELVFEIADWIREFQLDKNGGFITGHQQDGPGYTTALYLEGLSAAAVLASLKGDRRASSGLHRCVRKRHSLSLATDHPARTRFPVAKPGVCVGRPAPKPYGERGSSRFCSALARRRDRSLFRLRILRSRHTAHADGPQPSQDTNLIFKPEDKIVKKPAKKHSKTSSEGTPKSDPRKEPVPEVARETKPEGRQGEAGNPARSEA